LGNLNRELFALNRLGVVAGQEGAFDQAERFFSEVHTRALAVGNHERAMSALNNLGVVASRRKDYAQAREYAQQALALAVEIGAQYMIAMELSTVANTDSKLGELSAARTGLREALALARRLGALPLVVLTVVNFGELAYAEGQTERALVLLGLARTHPAWSSEDQRNLDATLAEWALDPLEVEAGMAKGAELDWDKTIEELL